MKELKFVDVGEGITEGQVREFLVEDMTDVKEDQPIVKIETDKAIVDVPSPVSGIMKIKALPGSKVNVGDTIAYIGTKDEIASVETAGKPSVRVGVSGSSEQPKSTETTSQMPARETDKEKRQDILATPSVRKLARELEVDLYEVIGTGPNGRIVENDVKLATATGQHKPAPLPKFSEILEEQHSGEIERVSMSMTRKTIAKNMELSWTIPRATHGEMIDATKLFEIVERIKPEMQAKGIKLTFLPFMVKAVAEAVKENPRFNSSYDKEKGEIIIKKYFNIGLAAEGPDGLKVVVIKSADRKPIIEIAGEIQELGQKVKNQKISIDDMRDSTITLTNIGSLGGGYMAVPMINYPEVAIIGAMRMKDMPWVIDGKIVIRKIMPMSVTFDHRVVDGADAVVFMNLIKKYLEDPDFLEML